MLRPHICILIFFYGLTIAIFYPIFFQGKALQQGDIQQYSNSIQRISKHRHTTGEEPLWNPSIFSGMPTYISGVRWNYPVLGWVQGLFVPYLPHPVWILFACLLWSYVLLLCFDMRPLVALSGALVFTFSSYLLIGIDAGHNARMAAVAYLPMILAGVRLGYGRLWYLGLGIAALGVALQLKSNHIQITYYTLFAVLFYIAFQAYIFYKERQLTCFLWRSGWLLGAALLGFSTYYGQFSAMYKYSQHSIRGERILSPKADEPKEGLSKSYAFEYSNAPMESMTLIIPNFYGGRPYEPLGPQSQTAQALRKQGAPQKYLQYAYTYRGAQPITSPYYAGAAVFFLVTLGILLLKGREKYWLLALGFFALLLTWGKHAAGFNNVLFDYLPGYNKFRSHTFATMLIILVCAIFSGLALERSLKIGNHDRWMKRFWQAIAITGGILLLVQLGAGLGNYSAPMDERLQAGGLPSWYLEALRADRLALLRKDTWRSLFYVLLAAGMLYVIAKHKIRLRYGLIGMAALLLFDLLPIAVRYFSPTASYDTPHKARTYAISGADQRIQQDTSAHYRVFHMKNPFNDNRVSSLHRSVGGYHAAKLRRYQDIIETGLAVEQDRLINSAKKGRPDLSHLPISDMLNVKYFIFGNRTQDILPNDSPCGAAWLVKHIQPVAGPDEEITALQNINPCQTATWDLHTLAPKDTLYNNQGTVELQTYTPNEIVYQIQNEGSALLVMSEIYYPEWKAYVNKKEQPLLRVNYLLRALRLPPGTHTIHLKMSTDTYLHGRHLKRSSSIAILLLCLGSLSYIAYRKWKRNYSAE